MGIVALGLGEMLLQYRYGFGSVRMVTFIPLCGILIHLWYVERIARIT